MRYATTTVTLTSDERAELLADFAVFVCADSSFYPWLCTRPRGHEGRHIATTGRVEPIKAVAAWEGPA